MTPNQVKKFGQKIEQKQNLAFDSERPAPITFVRNISIISASLGLPAKPARHWLMGVPLDWKDFFGEFFRTKN